MHAGTPPYIRRGSSPHTRGAPPRRARAQLVVRDHPRIRGEHVEIRRGIAVAAGIIPAYAGSTDWYGRQLQVDGGSSPHTRGARWRSSSRSSAQRDHPRIRGEHGHKVSHRRGRRGIIPAYAGSTLTKRQQWKLTQGSSPHTRGARRVYEVGELFERDHPRIRGEHAGAVGDGGGVPGIIPAYAGSTNHRQCHNLLYTGSSPHTRGAPTARKLGAASRVDHPRIRGEHPRAGVGVLERPGIIPAYAGSTESALAATSDAGDHPRIRGEHRW